MCIPYTYLIGWSKKDIWYYGVRFARNCNPEELWKSYFTSSKAVKNFRIKNGDPDIIEIRKIFDNCNKARLWESKVLKRLNAARNPRWLNQTDNISIVLNEESRNKVISSITGRKWNKPHPNKGKKILKLSGKTPWNKGKKIPLKLTEEESKKRSEILKTAWANGAYKDRKLPKARDRGLQ